MRFVSLLRLVTILLASVAVVLPTQAQTTLLNVSYDVARELYKQVNPAFEAYYQEKHGEKINVKQSHGGSINQCLRLLIGLQVELLTRNQASDMEMLEKKGMLAKVCVKQFLLIPQLITTTLFS